MVCCCSMGGVLVKEMLVKAMAAHAPAHHKRLADATVGLVFYACPHNGSWLAGWGWNLRYVGASPALSVVHLKPGLHLQVGVTFLILSYDSPHLACKALLLYSNNC